MIFKKKVRSGSDDSPARARRLPTPKKNLQLPQKLCHFLNLEEFTNHNDAPRPPPPYGHAGLNRLQIEPYRGSRPSPASAAVSPHPPRPPQARPANARAWRFIREKRVPGAPDRREPVAHRTFASPHGCIEEKGGMAWNVQGGATGSGLTGIGRSDS